VQKRTAPHIRITPIDLDRDLGELERTIRVTERANRLACHH
jgi:hypothetical protein